MTKIISFASGKGGVGKSSLVANLGVLFAKQKKRVLLIDADWALGKLSLMFDARPKWTVENVLNHTASMNEAVFELQPTLHLLASPSGIVGFEELSEATRHQLFFEIEQLAPRYDVVLLDHSSGVHWGVLPFAAAAHHHVIVTTPEPTSYMDAYAIMKILSKRFRVQNFSLIVTTHIDPHESGKIIERFLEVTRSNLGVRVQCMDILNWEPRVAESIRQRKPYVELFPLSHWTSALKRIRETMDGLVPELTGGLQFVFSKANFS